MTPSAAGRTSPPDQTPDAPALLECLAAPAGSALPLPRLLLVFAHPDDEVLALGGRLERLHASRLLTVTDGAPMDGADAVHHGFSSLEQYRQTRQNELAAAMASAGLALEPLSVAAPGFPVSDQTAAQHLIELTQAVARVLVEFAPEAILTHPYEGGHPDHDACAIAVHLACDLVHAQGWKTGLTEPAIVEAPFYHAGPAGNMETGMFLHDSNVREISVPLSAAEQARKRSRLACFRSQQETLQQFGTERESFRVAPRYDFTQPPHQGTLFYEQFSWGMTGDRLCTLATTARHAVMPAMPRPQPATVGA